MNKTKLTVIVDNISSEDLCGEWGLSILVQHNDKMILVDAGSTDLFAENLKKLGFDIKDIDYGVQFYLRENTGENCYKKKRIFKKYIGIPKHLLKDYPDRIEMVSGDHKLCEGVYLIPHKTPGLDKIGKRERMLRRTDKGWVFDDFSHEQSLVLDTQKGLVIINSCSHGGAVNIINEVKSTFPDRHVYGLIGGLHLFNKSDEEVKRISEEIKKTGIDYVCTGHCTKDRAYAIMKEILKDKVDQLRVGLVMEF